MTCYACGTIPIPQISPAFWKIPREFPEKFGNLVRISGVWIENSSVFNEHSSGLNTSWFRQKVSFLSTYCWATARRDWITKISHVLKPYTSWVSHVCPSPKFKAGRRYCMCSSKVLRSTTGFFNLLKFYAQCFPLKFSTYLLSFLLIKVYSILFK